MTLIATVTKGRVTRIWGRAYIVKANGLTQPLSVGEVVESGNRVITDQGSIVEIIDEYGGKFRFVSALEAAPSRPSVPDVLTDKQTVAEASAAFLEGTRVVRLDETLKPLAFSTPAALAGAPAFDNRDTGPVFRWDIDLADGGPTLPLAKDDGSATAPAAFMQEDATVPLVINVLGNDVDPNGDVLKVIGATSSNGSVSVNPDGSLIFTPSANFHGVATIVYTISDGRGGSSSATAYVGVTATNDAPQAIADTFVMNEDAAAQPLALRANDTDIDGDALAVSAIAGAPITPGVPQAITVAGGTVNVAADGSISFLPAVNFNGLVNFNYTITDGNGATSTASVSGTVVAANDAPIAFNDLAVATEDVSLVLAPAALFVNDIDLDGDGLSIASVQQASNGTVALVNGNVVFTPQANYNGPAQFSYTISDGQGGTSTATVNVTVGAVNDAPAAANAAVTVVEDTPLSATLPAATDIDGDAVTYSLASATAHGTVVVNADGSYTYAPAANYNGSDSFTYTISDGNGGSATYTVALSVNPGNDDPVANPDAFTVIEDGAALPLDLLANDTDIDGNALTVSAIAGTPRTPGVAQNIPVTGGVVNVAADGAITFTPAANFNGPVAFAYSVSDGNGGTSTSTVAGTVTAVNDNPVAVNDGAPATPAATLAEDGTSAPITVLGNDTDVDGDTLTVTAASSPNGIVAINPDGTLTFTPTANFNGPTTISYTVSDGQGGTATATVAISVLPVNDAPVAANASATTNEDTVLNATLPVASDLDGNAVTYALASSTINGTVVVNTDGSYSYTPAVNYSGGDSFTYTVSDGQGGNNTYTVTLTVNAVNDAPITFNDSVPVIEDTPSSGNVLGNDTDPEGSALTVTQFEIGGTTYAAGVTATLAQGTLVISADGSFTFTPFLNYIGPVPTATYTVSDGVDTATASLSLGPVSATNDAPVAVDDGTAGAPAATVAEDASVVGINVLGNDTDPDGNTLSVSLASSAQGVVVINANGTLTFTPNANFNGPATITYTVTDGALTDTATVYVNVTAVNDAPTTTNDTAAVVEDTPTSGNVLGNDTDPEGSPLSVTQFEVGGTTYPAGATATLVGIGTLSINGLGAYTFTPLPNYVGPVPVVTYTAFDGQDASTGTLTLGPVSNTNDAPDAVDDGTAAAPAFTVAEDGSNPAINALANDIDIDGNALTIIAASSPNGVVAINGDGTLTFTPSANYFGPATISYTVSDGTLSDTATVYLQVTPVNDAPIANDDTTPTTEDTAATGNVLSNDTDLEGDALSVTQFEYGGTTVAAGSLVSIAGVGSLQINSNGTFTFTPAPNYNGAVPVATYTLSDGSATDTATLSLTPIASVNDDPFATGDTVSVTEDTPATGNVLTNDSDLDGDALSVSGFEFGGIAYAAGTLASIAGVGTLVVEANGDFTFTPALNYAGAVPAATYTISDGVGGSASAPLSFGSVTPVNDAPVANDDSSPVTEDTVTVGNVLANDIDTEGDPLLVTQFEFGVTTVAAGSTITVASIGGLRINADGSYTFTPALNYNGAVPLATYTLSDGGATTDTATLSLTPVAAVNDAPTANDDALPATEDTPVLGNVLANDSDVDGNPLTVSQFEVGGTSYPAGSTVTMTGIGSLVINVDGSFTFTPVANYTGAVPAVTYTVIDGQGGSATAALTLGPVAAENDAPDANDDVAPAVIEDTPASGNVLGNDSDVDGNALNVTGFEFGGVNHAAGATATIAGVGALVINSDGSYVFTPAANYAGAVPLATYTVSDGQLSDTATLSLTPVAPVNDSPNANPDAVVVTEDTAASGNVLANDTDVDGLPPVVTQFVFNGIAYAAGQTAVIGGVGSLIINADGTFVLTPAANFVGTMPSATYTISDGLGGTAASTLSFGNVVAVNDAPLANDDVALNAIEDTVSVGNVLGNDSDVDGNPLAVTQFEVDGTTYSANTVAVLAGVGTLGINADGNYTFTPEPNYNGAVPLVTYTVSDGTATDTATLTLSPVAAVNDAPVAVADSVTVTEDTAASGNVLVNDFDVDGDPLSVTQFEFDGVTYPAGTLATLPGIGTLTIDSSGAYTFTPATDYAGPVPTATYTVSDGQGATATGTLTLGNVAPVNDAPVAIDDFASVDEDTVATGNLLANDTDVEGAALSVTQFTFDGIVYNAGDVATVVGVGSLLITTTGAFTFTPALNYFGPVPAVTYVVSDGTATDTGALTLGPVNPLNDAPVAGDDTFTINEDQTLNVPFSALLVDGVGAGTDTDVDGDALTIVSVQDAVNGSVLIVGGNVVFTPNANFNGTASFTYVVSDGNGGFDTAAVSINVVAVNDAPLANNDSVAVVEDTPATGNVLDNDSDIEGSPLTLTSFEVSGTSHAAGTSVTIAGVGQLTVAADGNYTFTPASHYNGAVPVVTYTVSDGAASSQATLTLGPVTGVNDAPAAAPDTVPVIEDTVATANVLLNDADVDGDPLTVTQFAFDGITYSAGTTASVAGVGDLVIDSLGNLTFTPAPHYNGDVPAVSYTVSDGQGSNATAAVTIGPITAVNDAPMAVGDSFVVAEDSGATALNLLANDTDVDGDTLSITSIAGTPLTPGTAQIIAVAGGTVNVTSGGAISFTPSPNASGPVSFAYTISDGNGGTSTATVNGTVTPVNDDPVATPDTVAVVEDTPATGNVLGNDTDVDGDALLVSSFTYDGVTYAAGTLANVPGVGSLVINSTGDFTFTPALNYNGAVPAVTYSVTDNLGGVATGALTLGPVSTVNDAPDVNADTYSVVEDAPATVLDLLANDVDVDGTPLVITNLAGTPITAGTAATVSVVGGTINVSSAGVVTFTPTSNFNGTFGFNYTASDGSLSTSASVNIEVTAANDAPVANTDTASVVEDTPTSGNVLSNDTDVEGNALVVTQFDVAGTPYTAGTTAVIAGVGTLVINSAGDFTFTPLLNYNGAVPAVTYTISDGQGGSATAALDLGPVSAVNDDPVAVLDSFITDEDTTSLPIDVLINDTDVDGNPLALTSIDGVAVVAGVAAIIPVVGGVVNVSSAGVITFTPTANFNGPVTFTYGVSDGAGGTATGTVSGSITAINDTPVAADDALSVDEDSSSTPLDLLANDGDVDGDPLVLASIAGVAITPGVAASIAVGNGTVNVSSAGAVTFTPTANFAGVASFAYTIVDGQGGTATANATVTVGAVNDAPVNALPAAIGTNEDTSVAIVGLSISDVDAAGGSLTVTLAVNNGTLIVSGGGAAISGSSSSSVQLTGTVAQINATLSSSVTFVPTPNLHGSSTLTMTTSDNGNVGADPGLTGGVGDEQDVDTVAITTTAVVDTPSLTINHPTTNTVVAQTNFQTGGSSATGLPGGNWRTDNAGDAIEIANSTAYIGGADTGNLVLELESTAGAASDLYTDVSVIRGEAYRLDLAYAARTANLTDSDIQVFWQGQLITTLSSRSNSLQNYQFNLIATSTGTARLEFQAVDTNAGGGVLDNLVLTRLGATAIAGQASLLPTPMGALADTDGSETLSYSLQGLPVGAVVSDGSNSFTATAGNTTANITGWSLGTLTITPPLALTGAMNLSYTATATESSNGTQAGTTQAFVINVVPGDAAPVAVADTGTSAEESAIAGNVLSNDTDANGDALALSSFTVLGTGTFNAGATATITNVGTLTMQANGAYTFTPVQHYSGTVPSVSYVMRDGDGYESSSTLTLNVTPVTDAPTLQALPSIAILHSSNTVISTTAVDAIGQPDTDGVTQANLEIELGVAAGFLDNRFDPTGPNVNDPGFIDVFDGKITSSQVAMTAGMLLTWDYTFTNGENLASEVLDGYNDIVVLVVTDPLGGRQTFLVDSSEEKFPALTSSGAYSFSAPTAGNYTFDWLVLNARDGFKDSTLSLNNTRISLPSNPSFYSTPVAIPTLGARLVDTDGSETLSIKIAGFAPGSIFTAGTDNGDGSWTFTQAEMANLMLLVPQTYTGTMNLTVTAIATDGASAAVSTSQTMIVTVASTSNTFTTSTQAGQTLTGTAGNDIIRGYAGNDTINAGNGADHANGGAGNDAVNGQAGDDMLYGDVGNDSLNGSTGNDVLNGGAGTDTLVGGTQSDRFVWISGDQGLLGAPTVDTISDFSNVLGGDVIDVRNLLIGENYNNLSNYLHFTFSVATNATTLSISTAGGYGAGYSLAQTSQTIVFTNVNLVGAYTSDAQVIDDLIARHLLVVDIGTSNPILVKQTATVIVDALGVASAGSEVEFAAPSNSSIEASTLTDASQPMGALSFGPELRNVLAQALGDDQRDMAIDGWLDRLSLTAHGPAAVISPEAASVAQPSRDDAPTMELPGEMALFSDMVRSGGEQVIHEWLEKSRATADMY